jgi:hypothetical protein
MLFAVKLEMEILLDQYGNSDSAGNSTSLTGIEDTLISLAMNQHTLQIMRGF